MPLHRAFILLLCLCALALRAGGTHVHVALDHDEAPHELHHEPHLNAHDQHDVHANHDAGQHNHVLHDADMHQHVEVSLDNQALSKKPDTDLATDTLLLAALLLCILLAPRKLLLPLIRQTLPPSQRLTHLRPPLRGPPLLA